MIKFRNLKQSVTGSPQPKLESNFHLIENSENTNSIEMMDHLKESLARRTFNKISYAAVLIWFVISVIFFGIFAEVENTESRYDFWCGGAKSENIDLIRGECFEKYEKQHNKYGVPVYGFVITNFLLIAIVCVIYSQTVIQSLICRRAVVTVIQRADSRATKKAQQDKQQIADTGFL